MIKPEELRKGNWLDFNGRAFQVDYFANGDTIKLRLLSGPVHIESLNPTPITGEQLKKLGFEKANDLDDYYYLELNKYTKLYYSVKHSVAEISVSMHGYIIRPTEYVHQIQNLYFDLEGKELLTTKPN